MRLRPSWLALCALTAACAPAPLEPEPPAYVGAVEGTDALIAFVPEDNTVIGYVCAEERWAEHSGWFRTELENEAELVGPVKDAQSATGHRLEGVVITPTTASGTVQFADGTRHSFTAERASSSTAGLFESHASEGQAGLIITNDGRSAGVVKVNTGDDDLPPAPQQVTLNASAGIGSRITGINVVLGGLGPRTLTRIVPRQNVVTASGPTLFILVHGMNHSVGSDPRTIDSPQQSRVEWDLDFVQGLLAGPEVEGGPNMPMFNFAGGPVTRANFRDPDVLPRFDANAAEAQLEGLDALASHFITAESRVGDVTAGGLSARSRVPLLSAFITYRNAAGGLVESGERIANESYVALRWYELHFGRTPKVVFVTQSFGGVAARFVLSNPTQAQLAAPGTPAMNADNIVISAEDRRRMDYVRDRIMYAVTLGTPHEGSFIADLFVPLQDKLLRLEQSLSLGTNSLDASLRALGTLLGQLDELADEVADAQQTRAQTAATVRAALAETRRQVEGRALRDLTHPFWARVNAGPLHPGRARRTGASPILRAGGQLIPIYAAGARTPGGRAFTAPELAVFSRLQQENAKEQEWMINTTVTDLLLHTERLSQGGFGRSTQGLYAGFDAQLDRRERVVDGAAFARAQAQALASSISPWFAERYGAGVEGLVSFAMGNARLVSLPIYLDHKGHFDLGASVELPVPAFQCTDGGRVFPIVLDFGRLLTSMSATFGSLTNAASAIRTLDLNGLLDALSLTGSNVDDILGWFLGKYEALQVPQGRCELPTSLGSLLSAGNLLNWSVVDATDRFPAPRWVEDPELASDDEIDDDGVVAMDSAVGFSLGTTTPLFFEHTRTDAPNSGAGSWYRLFDSPVEAECHGMQHQWNIGQWTLQTFRTAGPVPTAAPLSVFLP